MALVLRKVALHYSIATGTWRSAAPHDLRIGVLAGCLSKNQTGRHLHDGTMPGL